MLVGGSMNTVREQRAAVTLRSAMLDLDYSAGAVALYARLLMRGPHGAASLRDLLGWPDPLLRSALHRLARDGLVGEGRRHATPVWYCRDPSTAWLSMAAATTWEVTTTLSPISALPDTGHADVERRKSLLLTAARCAIALWTPQSFY